MTLKNFLSAKAIISFLFGAFWLQCQSNSCRYSGSFWILQAA